MPRKDKKIDMDHGYTYIALKVYRTFPEPHIKEYNIYESEWGTPRGARRLRRFVRMMSANIRSYWEE